MDTPEASALLDRVLEDDLAMIGRHDIEWTYGDYTFPDLVAMAHKADIAVAFWSDGSLVVKLPKVAVIRAEYDSALIPVPDKSAAFAIAALVRLGATGSPEAIDAACADPEFLELMERAVVENWDRIAARPAGV
jgi:hypothetical protein